MRDRAERQPWLGLSHINTFGASRNRRPPKQRPVEMRETQISQKNDTAVLYYRIVTYNNSVGLGTSWKSCSLGAQNQRGPHRISYFLARDPASQIIKMQSINGFNYFFYEYRTKYAYIHFIIVCISLSPSLTRLTVDGLDLPLRGPIRRSTPSIRKRQLFIMICSKNLLLNS